MVKKSHIVNAYSLVREADVKQGSAQVIELQTLMTVVKKRTGYKKKKITLEIRESF